MSHGHFELVELLGTGAFALVVVARDRRRDGRLVALKVLREPWLADPTALNRFRDEARILRALRHPAIVGVDPILDYDGRPVLVMDYIRGATLEELFVTRPAGLPWEAAIAATMQLADGLHAAYHGQYGTAGEPMRIVHRDVKPANAMVDVHGTIKLLDFGIATGDFADRRTRSLYNVAGTAGYDAPERRLGDGKDSPGSDVYALAVTLFVLLTRKALLLTADGEAHGRASRVAAARVEPEGLADPGPLRELIVRMLAYDPSQRPSMAEVASSLDGILRAQGRPMDVPALTAAAASAAHERRKVRGIEGHPEAGRLRFLELDPSTPPPTRLTPEEARPRLVALLQQPDWEARVAEVQRILDAAPDVDTSPFHDVLDRAQVPGWRFWVRAARPSEVETALIVLCDRRDSALLARAKRLASHPHDRVARAARYLVQRAGG